MNEFDSPNYTEYAYDKKAEGKMRILKYLLVVGYVLFVAAFFLVCYITRFIPVFAVCPVITWIIVFFTWPLVSFDVYYTFEHGHMEFGKVKKRKSGSVRTPSIKLEVQTALVVMPYKKAVETVEYKSVKLMHDFSTSLSSPSLIMIIYTGAKGNEAVVFESTPKLARLLTKYSRVAKDIVIA